MALTTTEISIEGKRVKVPALILGGTTIVVSGRWIKLASLQGEEYSEIELHDPEAFVKELAEQRSHGLGADIFTFGQALTATNPKYAYVMEWDSIAAIRVLSFSDWWTNRVSSYLRKDVRKAKKLGVVVRQVPFNDDFVKGIMEIYDEVPIRQGRPFWHYKKGFDAVKRENATYLERSDFLGAYWGDELIGFLKIVYVNRVARLMQIISKDSHRDKRPMNALIASAVEVCEAKGAPYLTYGKYRYSQGVDSVTAFKHRNGFEEILVPRYYVPLTSRGRVALCLRLHRGARELVPDPVLRALKRIKAFVYDHPQLTRKTI
jgi:hypothetical protein